MAYLNNKKVLFADTTYHLLDCGGVFGDITSRLCSSLPLSVDAIDGTCSHELGISDYVVEFLLIDHTYDASYDPYVSAYNLDSIPIKIDVTSGSTLYDIGAIHRRIGRGTLKIDSRTDWETVYENRAICCPSTPMKIEYHYEIGDQNTITTGNFGSSWLEIDEIGVTAYYNDIVIDSDEAITLSLSAKYGTTDDSLILATKTFAILNDYSNETLSLLSSQKILDLKYKET